ncbi:HupE/UreJ family protein [filamentous cyanobacterium LEGE 11480]|uniref:HupE/UreJ family protein n=1 Tax=Romeriopsis navalis LEGE 11480 TaxID=2777977 RepID=A0A928VS45_9CYAN|nr:HupE/UreJ family protein [Romeriopsis navalis]MBE9032753.1 HupE/UreJ family protein [Romeriopsis navalis LEGE 11480]
MLHSLSNKLFAKLSLRIEHVIVAIALVLGLCLVAQPVLAHHPMGGRLPSNALEGFLSGVGHPMIGLDHFAFVVAIGLLAAVLRWGLSLPIGFVMASLLGTGIHLMSLDLPAPEFFISLSVLLFGALLALRRHPHTVIILGLAMLAGTFHGYAYGEAIVGADMAPLLSYLLGFTSIQLLVSVVAYGVAKRLGANSSVPPLSLRFCGFALTGIGSMLLTSTVLG